MIYFLLEKEKNAMKEALESLKLRNYDIGKITKETFIELADLWKNDTSIKSETLAELIVELLGIKTSLVS